MSGKRQVTEDSKVRLNRKIKEYIRIKAILLEGQVKGTTATDQENYPIPDTVLFKTEISAFWLTIKYTKC